MFPSRLPLNVPCLKCIKSIIDRWFLPLLFLMPCCANALSILVSSRYLYFVSRKTKYPEVFSPVYKYFTLQLKGLPFLHSNLKWKGIKSESYFHFPNMAFEVFKVNLDREYGQIKMPLLFWPQEEKKNQNRNFPQWFPLLENWSLNHHAVWHTLQKCDILLFGDYIGELPFL